MKFFKDKVLLIIALVLILGGIIVFLYPTVSNYLAEKNQSEVIREYQGVVSELDEETIKEELEKAQTYNENLSGDPVHDPFVEGSGYALPDDYTDVLNISGDGVMAYIEIPTISVYLPIYHGTDEEVLEKGVGHIQQTSLPIGGESTHAVLTGHTGLPTTELFTRIDELEVGDTFYIYVLDQTLKYEIYETKVIEPEDISELTIENGRDLVTLVTCTPYGVNTHRLLVMAERTEYIEEEEEIEVLEEEKENTNLKLYILGTIIGLIILLIIIITVIIVKKKKSKTNKKEGKKVKNKKDRNNKDNKNENSEKQGQKKKELQKIDKTEVVKKEKNENEKESKNKLKEYSNKKKKKRNKRRKNNNNKDK